MPFYHANIDNDRRVFDGPGDVDAAILAFGVLGDQDVSERDAEAALVVLAANFVGAVSVAIPVVGG